MAKELPKATYEPVILPKATLLIASAFACVVKLISPPIS